MTFHQILTLLDGMLGNCSDADSLTSIYAGLSGLYSELTAEAAAASAANTAHPGSSVELDLANGLFTNGLPLKPKYASEMLSIFGVSGAFFQKDRIETFLARYSGVSTEVSLSVLAIPTLLSTSFPFPNLSRPRSRRVQAQQMSMPGSQILHM